MYDWESDGFVTNLDYPAHFIEQCLAPYGFSERWSYRTDTACRGLDAQRVAELCRTARLLVIHGDPLPTWRPEYDLIQRRAFVDIDPGFTQWRLASGDRSLTDTIDRCHRLLTIGHRVGAPGGVIPDAGRDWVITRPPVSLAHWRVPSEPLPDAAPFTTVM